MATRANPYIVSLDLAGKMPSTRAPRGSASPRTPRVPIAQKDARGNTLCYVLATAQDKHLPACLKLANVIWRARFGVQIAERELSGDDMDDHHRAASEPERFTLLVVCINNSGSPLKPVAAARVAYLERGDIKTAKIYSVASSSSGEGWGRILLNKLRELATAAACRYMTVDVTRPTLRKLDDIRRFVEDKSERTAWRDEKPALYKNDQNIDSSTRTQRVTDMLRFYWAAGFQWCITPGNVKEGSSSQEGSSPATPRDTPWGRVDPSYSYMLVAILEDTRAPELVHPSASRLVRWANEGDLDKNYSSHAHTQKHHAAPAGASTAVQRLENH